MNLGEWEIGFALERISIVTVVFLKVCVLGEISHKEAWERSVTWNYLFDNESMKDFPYLNNEERRENDPKGALER